MKLIDHFVRHYLFAENARSIRGQAIFQQQNELKKLLSTARNTAFGRQFGFEKLLVRDCRIEDFQQKIPVSDYKSMYEPWWAAAVAGKTDVTWPGRVPFFAMSGGTTGSRQKMIPVSEAMLRSIRRGGTRQFLAMTKMGLPARHFQKKILCVSASSDLKKNEFGAREGYISGITTAEMPKWFEFYHKPGRQINGLGWEEKLEEIVRQAPKWDVGSLVGLPSWTQLLIEKIMVAYDLRTIHDLWPNLSVFQHSGMNFEPYRVGFERLLARPIHYLESYFASEGLFAITDRPGESGMRLLTNGGIFFEFIPFDGQNFDANGELLPGHKALAINDLSENKLYALLISTNSGAWRYLLGDVVEFTNLERLELRVAGRTTTWMNLCGESLTEAHLNEAVAWLNEVFNAGIREFCITPGRAANGWFAHRWFLASNCSFSEDFLAKKLDEKLCELNDYYELERSASLVEVSVKIVPAAFFKKWLAEKGRIEPQRKFPRVLNGSNLALWEKVISELKTRKNHFVIINNQ